MLVNTHDMLKKAQEGLYAVPQFNINNLEWTKYVLEVCEEMNSPVILGVSEGAIKYMGGYKSVYNLVTALVDELRIIIPVVLHLDHGSSVESCKKAIDAGFTSVMIDSSSYPLNKNIAMVKEVVDYARPRNVTVEAEVGHIGGTEDEISSDIAYASLEDCEVLVSDTHVNSLAPALGSVHGLYKGEPKIDLVQMAAIKGAVRIPLVLHGGTGIPDEIIRNSINCGICKININTELQISWASAVRAFLNSDNIVYDPRKIIGSGEKALKDAARTKMILFKSNNKAG